MFHKHLYFTSDKNSQWLWKVRTGIRKSKFRRILCAFISHSYSFTLTSYYSIYYFWLQLSQSSGAIIPRPSLEISDTKWSAISQTSRGSIVKASCGQGKQLARNINSENIQTLQYVVWWVTLLFPYSLESFHRSRQIYRNIESITTLREGRGNLMHPRVQDLPFMMRLDTMMRFPAIIGDWISPHAICIKPTWKNAKNRCWLWSFSSSKP